jgi:hypothetical protein
MRFQLDVVQQQQTSVKPWDNRYFMLDINAYVMLTTGIVVAAYVCCLPGSGNRFLEGIQKYSVKFFQFCACSNLGPSFLT